MCNKVKEFLRYNCFALNMGNASDSLVDHAALCLARGTPSRIQHIVSSTNWQIDGCGYFGVSNIRVGQLE